MRLGIVSSVILIGLFVSGCDHLPLPADFCNPLSGVKAKVKMQGASPVAVGTQVLLGGRLLGKVTVVEGSGTAVPVLTLCLDKKRLPELARVTIFYLDDSAPNGALLTEVEKASGPVPDKDAVFLGFPTYAQYVGFKTRQAVKRGVDDFLRAVDDAVR